MRGDTVDEIRYLVRDEPLTAVWLAGMALGFLAVAALLYVA